MTRKHIPRRSGVGARQVIRPAKKVPSRRGRRFFGRFPERYRLAVHPLSAAAALERRQAAKR